MNEKTARKDYMINVLISNRKTIIGRFNDYGLCKKCWKPKTDDYWCKSCNAAHFRKDFEKWTSGNNEIDHFIQNTQIHAWNYDLVLEWYPWESLSEIEEIGKGGFATVFRAKPKVQRIQEWNRKKKVW